MIKEYYEILKELDKQIEKKSRGNDYEGSVEFIKRNSSRVKKK